MRVVYPEDGGSKLLLNVVDIYCQAARRHIPEDLSSLKNLFATRPLPNTQL
jgi:hypothetical protein